MASGFINVLEEDSCEIISSAALMNCSLSHSKSKIMAVLKRLPQWFIKQFYWLKNSSVMIISVNKTGRCGLPFFFIELRWLAKIYHWWSSQKDCSSVLFHFTFLHYIMDIQDHHQKIIILLFILRTLIENKKCHNVQMQRITDAILLLLQR